MAVADIPSELIVNVRSSWDQFLWLLPGPGLYRWDKNIGYMYAYGAIPVDGQGLPPGPPVPNPDAPFSLGELSYLNSLYVRTVNDLKPNVDGDVALTIVPAPPEDGWSATAFTTAVQTSLGLADTASQPGHTHTAAQISDATSTGRTLLTAADAAAARAATGAASATLVLTAGAGLTGGGDLSAGRTFALTAAAQASLARADTAVQPASLSAYIRTVNGVGPDANGNVAITIEGGGYVKPAGGIPSTDMTSAVQASLGKADTALQAAPVTSVAGKTGAVTLVPSDVGAAAASHTHTASQISDSTTIGRSLLTASDAAAVRTLLSIGNVNNTADADKPVSTLQAAADASILSQAKTYTDGKVADTGWIPLTANTGWTLSSNAAYRVVGNFGYLRGQVQLTSGNITATGTNFATIPTAAHRPPQVFAGIVAGAGSIFSKIVVNPNGSIDYNTPSASTAYLRLDGVVYPVN